MRNSNLALHKVLLNVLLTILLGLGLQADLALANSGGPNDGLTGAPGEGNCTQCHTTFPLNSGSGMISLNGITGLYSPDNQHTLEIVLDDPDASRWGFEFTILDNEGVSMGTLTPTDGNTQVSTGGAFNRTYGKHTSVGTQNGTSGSASWFLQWDTPPVGAGDLTLYVAANGANGNFGTSGDRIYTASFPLEESTSTGVEEQAALPTLFTNYPNPFNPKTTVSFNIQRDTDVNLLVLDVAGRVIKTLYSGAMEAGHHELIWDGQDERGQQSPSGIYFARLLNGEGRDIHAAHKMILLK